MEEADGSQTQACPAPGPPPAPAQHDGGRLHATSSPSPGVSQLFSVVSQLALSSQRPNVVQFSRYVGSKRSFAAVIVWRLNVFSI